MGSESAPPGVGDTATSIFTETPAQVARSIASVLPLTGEGPLGPFALGGLVLAGLGLWLRRSRQPNQ